ncbi:MAG: galactose ABC transporter substrate-binding protein [Peptoniphilaceae bacterium]|nr:galactose ABC transporter substrate-binding protein [Peptoniphilaceae bacterium]MDD7383672.1 galactose ABC transporter substrate-binding protein [Peptoniphilaceae bacterium]MDY3738769.1 galactose ABC transporter substrate-binding protein [Peptoniphilaceae bacterium]
MKSKKFVAGLMTLAMSFAFTACSGGAGNTPAGNNATSADKASVTATSTETATTENKEGAKKIAVLLYKADDTYIATVRQALEKLDEADPDVELSFQDAGGDMGTQTDQINNVLAQGVDGILLNIVDVKAAPTAISTIEAKNIPTVFFNRDMSESIGDKTDEFLFVGTNAADAGVMQGEMLSKLWNEKSEEIDRNGNGVLDYVMLNGGVDNPEAQARTEYSVKTLEDAGIKTNELALQDAQWETEKAKTAMDSWLQTFDKDLDVVIANNDGMAIGAITALQAVGYNTGEDGATVIPVVGVDATEQAKEAIAKGTMFGTVLQDADGMAKGSLAAIKNKINGKDWIDSTDLKLADDGVSIRIPYQIYDGK